MITSIQAKKLAMQIRPAGGVKLPTGIEGLDKVLEGGLPLNRSVLVTGGPGDGKTVLLGEFIYQGIARFGQNGVFVTFEEKPEDIMTNFHNFGWQYEKLIHENKLMFVDASPTSEMIEEVSTLYSLSPVLERIKYAVKKVGAERVVIDGIRFLFQKFSNQRKIREILYNINNELKKMGVMSIITDERPSTLNNSTVQEYVSDGVIELARTENQNQIERFMTISKLRGAFYRSQKVTYEITDCGIRVFPKIIFNAQLQTNLVQPPIKKKFGIPYLDKALSGGIPAGHVLLIAGDSGTGKTTLALHFVVNGLSQKEKVLFVTLEESIAQIRQNALVYNWDLSALEEQGNLKFIAAPLTEIHPDRFLHQIADEAKKMQATRIVIDSISSLESAQVDKNKIIDFLVQLVAFCKSNQTTCILNYLSTGSDLNEVRLNSLVDGIILLKYVEDKRSIKKNLNILKLRGVGHKKEIFSYDINKKGFCFVKK